MSELRLRASLAALLLAASLCGCARTGVPANAILANHRAPETTARSAADEQELPGEPCVSDCSGQDAGYDWAEQKGIVDPNDCSGNSDAFFEGCMAYAEEQREERDTRDE